MGVLWAHSSSSSHARIFIALHVKTVHILVIETAQGAKQRRRKMDMIEMAEQIVKSINDARANDRPDLVAKLEAELSEINKRLAEDGFGPIEA